MNEENELSSNGNTAGIISAKEHEWAQRNLRVEKRVAKSAEVQNRENRATKLPQARSFKAARTGTALLFVFAVGSIVLSQIEGQFSNSAPITEGAEEPSGGAQGQRSQTDEIAVKLADCLTSSEFKVDFDGLGVQIKTTDLQKIRCASGALLGTQELPVELIKFAKPLGQWGYDNEKFLVGSGKIQVTVGESSVKFKIIIG